MAVERSNAIFCFVNKLWAVSTESATNASSRGSSPSDREIKQLIGTPTTVNSHAIHTHSLPVARGETWLLLKHCHLSSINTNKSWYGDVLNSFYHPTFGSVSIYQTLLLGFTIYLKTSSASNCTLLDLCSRQSGQKELDYWLVETLLCCHQEQEFKCKKNPQKT